MAVKLSGGRALALGLALAGAILPTAAHALGDKDRARAAIAEARGKIEAGDKAGVGGDAADVQARARTALSDAEANLRDGKVDRAYHAANDANALAGLAIATAEYRKLTTERAKLSVQ